MALSGALRADRVTVAGQRAVEDGRVPSLGIASLNGPARPGRLKACG
ncbi:MAG: hypothetical protein ACRYHQ_18220 [Janthinobacterium lividum]